jgi:hypothetical protein
MQSSAEIVDAYHLWWCHSGDDPPDESDTLRCNEPGISSI